MHKVVVPFEDNDLKSLVVDLYQMSIKSLSKDGPSHLKEYAALTVIHMFVFAIAYSTLYFCLNYILCGRSTAFGKMDLKKKSEYVGRIVSIIHALIVFATSTIGCFFIW